MTLLSDAQFRNVRLSFFKFISTEFAKTDYAKNNIKFRGESKPELFTDDVRCRLDVNGICGAGFDETNYYNKVNSPIKGLCNNYNCPEWMPTMINYDEIDYQVNDSRIIRLDFLQREMVNTKRDIAQVGVWGTKGDDQYKHKLYLLRDTVVDVLKPDEATGIIKSFKIQDWDSPEAHPPVLDGMPLRHLHLVVHLKDSSKRPVDDKGEFGETFTIWLISSARPDKPTKDLSEVGV